MFTVRNVMFLHVSVCPQEGGVRDSGVCMVGMVGDMGGIGGHAWQGACVVGGGACMHGMGVCVCAWQERRPL